jgi:hypothetical protein
MELQTVEELKELTTSKAEQVRQTFSVMSNMLDDLDLRYKEIIQSKENGITEGLCLEAKKLRLNIRKVRTETEKARKQQKKEYLLAGRAVDGIANILKFAVNEKETVLIDIENFFIDKETERLRILQIDRIMDITPYLENSETRDFTGMEDDVWVAFVAVKKAEFEQRAEDERLALELEKENQRLQVLARKRGLEISSYSYFADISKYDFNALLIMGETTYKTLIKKLEGLKSEHEWEQEKVRLDKVETQKQLAKERTERLKLEKEISDKKKKDRAELIEKEAAAVQQFEMEQAAFRAKAKALEDAKVKAENLGDEKKISALKTSLLKEIENYTFKSQKYQKEVAAIKSILK